MAIERALAKQPKIKAPKEAFCYIYLEGEGEAKSTPKLMRGCACRGASAGFVHLKCLMELVATKEASGEAVSNACLECCNCKQRFEGALQLEMRRHFWRRSRSSQKPRLQCDEMHGRLP